MYSSGSTPTPYASESSSNHQKARRLYSSLVFSFFTKRAVESYILLVIKRNVRDLRRASNSAEGGDVSCARTRRRIAAGRIIHLIGRHVTCKRPEKSSARAASRAGTASPRRRSRRSTPEPSFTLDRGRNCS